MPKLNKTKAFCCILGISLMIPINVFAAVYFMEKDEELNDRQPRSCQQRGYTVTVCPDNKTPMIQCDTGEEFYRTCGCNSDIYQFDEANCPSNQKPFGESCNNKFEACECDMSFYQYSNSASGTKCAEPKTPSGSFCTTNKGVRLYSSCQCPNKYKIECQYPLVGKDLSCNNKYKSCECSSEFKSCQHGGKGGSCTDKEGTRYRECLPMQCGSGYVNRDNYWCNKALRCYSPTSN